MHKTRASPSTFPPAVTGAAQPRAGAPPKRRSRAALVAPNQAALSESAQGCSGAARARAPLPAERCARLDGAALALQRGALRRPMKPKPPLSSPLSHAVAAARRLDLWQTPQAPEQGVQPVARHRQKPGGSGACPPRSARVLTAGRDPTTLLQHKLDAPEKPLTCRRVQAHMPPVDVGVEPR